MHWPPITRARWRADCTVFERRLYMKLSVITAVALLAAGPVAGTAFAGQATSATQAKPTDQELSSLIATKIANDKTLSTDAVKVTVEDGVVTLTGMVGKDADKARAEKLAHVPGVVRVENNLASREKATDKVKGTAGTVASGTKKGAEKTKDALSKTGENITDGWITSRIKAKFMANEATRASSINVDGGRAVDRDRDHRGAGFEREPADPRFRLAELARARAAALGVDEQHLPLVEEREGGLERLLVVVAAADREDAAVLVDVGEDGRAEDLRFGHEADLAAQVERR